MKEAGEAYDMYKVVLIPMLMCGTEAPRFSRDMEDSLDVRNEGLAEGSCAIIIHVV